MGRSVTLLKAFYRGKRRNMVSEEGRREKICERRGHILRGGGKE